MKGDETFNGGGFMRRAVIIALAAAALPSLSSAQSRRSLQGAWQVVEVSTTGPGASTTSSPQPGLYLFTARHYSLMRVLSPDPRPGFSDPANITAAEALAVWGPLQAQSGTYEVVSGSLNLLPIVAKNPGVMRAGRKPDVYTFTLQGDSLTLVQTSDGIGQVPNPTTLRLKRVE
jgi:hypothetical protein